MAHSILIIAYHIIQRRESYQDLGADYFDKQRPEKNAKRLVKRLQNLGYEVSLPSPVSLAPTD
ncbi:hypothetical protein [Myxosarcina sp. GI1(2024)]